MAERPNIVLIMTDQQRWDALGAYGNPYIQTPHLDRFAAEGAQFTHAFVPTPLCTPSRATVFTGQYATHHGQDRNGLPPMPEMTPTLVSALRRAGYQTALTGKNHLFATDGLSTLFDRVVLYDHAGRVPDGREDAAERSVREGRRGRANEPWIDVDPHAAADTPTARITDAAIAAVEEMAARERPFFLFLSYPDPHPPYVVAEPYARLYRGRETGQPAVEPGGLVGKPVRQRLAQRLMRVDQLSTADLRRTRELYFGMVAFLDDQIGRFLASLEQTGVAGGTIVVFMSDHGDYLGEHGMVRKSPAMYDCLIRIPLLVRWPGHIRPRVIDDTLVSTVDLAPTLLDLANLPPLAAGDGSSAAGLLRGTTKTHRDHVYGSYGIEGDPLTEAEYAALDVEDMIRHPVAGGNWLRPETLRGRMHMLRTRDWKLVCYEGAREGELYDLTADPNELRNLWDNPAAAGVRAALVRRLEPSPSR